MPYISASIIMQLMGIAVPAVQKMQKEGESGRKKINQWTRFLTIAITLGAGSRLLGVIRGERSRRRGKTLRGLLVVQRRDSS